MMWPHVLTAAALCVAVTAPAGAVSLSEDLWTRLASAQVVILGEVHDNPAHHAAQADIVARLAPAALVFEMIGPDQAARVSPELRGDAAALGAALDWEASGWPDFAMYHPIFTAAPGARVFGAGVTRATARAVMDRPPAQAFGEEAARFGLDRPLPEEMQAAREAMQMAAHCDALPAEMLPMMVDVQRLRDARLAQVALEALAATGGPVAVITGNGHARADWGMPVYLGAAAPDVAVFTLGQSEDGVAPDGTFDAILDAPAVDRPDPCLAFR